MALHPCVCCKPYQNQCWHIITVRAPAIQLRIILHALDITNKIPFEIYTLKIIIHEVYLKGHSVKSLWPHDAIWRHRSGSKLARLTACCMMPPSLCLNQCWLTISKVRWHSLESIIVRRYEDSNQQIMNEWMNEYLFHRSFQIITSFHMHQYIELDFPYIWFTQVI